MRLQQVIDATYMGYIQFNNGSGNVTNSTGISFGTGGSTAGPNSVPETMRINSSGQVGIGTTLPSYRLSVAGNNNGNDGIAITNTNTGGVAQAVLSVAAQGYTGIQILQNYTSGNYSIWGGDARDMAFSTSGTERMRLSSLGKLLLGTTSSPAGTAVTQVIDNASGGGIELVNNNSGGGNVSALSGGGLSFSTFTGAVGSEVYTPVSYTHLRAHETVLDLVCTCRLSK